MSLVARYGPGSAPVASSSSVVDVVDVVAAATSEPVAADPAMLERPRCDTCSWASVAGPCPGKGGATCSERERFERLARDGHANGAELERLEALRAADPVAVIVAPVHASSSADPAPSSSPVDLARMPYNYVTGAEYRGKNIDRLIDAAMVGGYSGHAWAGFQQWITLGRVVRKGEHGTACVTVIGDRSSSSDAGVEAGPYKGEQKKGRGVRGFRVFHYDQTTELEGEA